MHYVLVSYPEVDEALVGLVRRAHDPTVDLIRPHVPLVFPVPESLGLDRLTAHIERVLDAWRPFELDFCSLARSRDHWLFLIPGRGREELTKLHRELHTGLLAEYEVERYRPHLGLGLFLVEGATYDWEHPRPEDFDAARFETARRQAEALLAGKMQVVDAFYLAAVPDEVLEWSGGELPAPPEGVRVDDVRRFRLDG